MVLLSGLLKTKDWKDKVMDPQSILVPCPGGPIYPPGPGIQEGLVLFVNFMEWLVPPPPSKQFFYMVTPSLLK